MTDHTLTKHRHLQFATELLHTATATSTSIYRSFDPTAVPCLGYKGCQTLYEALRRGHSLNPFGPCLGFRAISTTGSATPFVYSSYTEILARVNAIAAGLDDLNLLKRNEDGYLMMGIYMKNCMEWTICEHATYCIGGATVPFYDTLGPDTISFILNQTNLSAVLCTRAQVPALIKAKNTGTCPKFETIIVIDGVIPETDKLCRDANINLISLARVESHGAHVLSTQNTHNSPEIKHRHSPPSGHDVATFCYTSGTTGNPKGALITHTNLLAHVSGLEIFDIIANETDRHLSYLPLPHIFERVVQASMICNGASIAFYRGDPLYLLEDIIACRPTIIPVAPRVLNKIHDKILAGVISAGGLKKKLFFAALHAKTQGLKHGQLKHGLYDALIFNKIKKALGMDCVRVMVSGSAPLSTSVMTFFRCMLGVPVLEGYGQTEGTASATLSHPDDVGTMGHVGGPVGCCEVKLVDVPEMGYLSKDTSHRGKPCVGRGEILVRGPTVFQGYYKDLEKTKETIDEEGWLHSGDIGLWTLEGALQIIDRKKNIFKLAQGEYVAAEKIENILNQSLFIGQNFVYGDSFQSALVAIIVPDEDVVRKWASDTGDSSLSGLDFKALCKLKSLKSTIMKEIKDLSKQNGLHGFETPRAIYLESEPFTAENGLTTPTFKLKRQQLRDHYQQQIDAMYAAMPPPPSKL